MIHFEHSRDPCEARHQWGSITIRLTTKFLPPLQKKSHHKYHDGFSFILALSNIDPTFIKAVCL